MRIKLCACGCKKPVAKPRNKYIRGHNQRGKKWPVECKEKIKGEGNPFYGKRHTPESKRRIGKASKGKNNPMFGKRREETGFYGKKHTLESREKIRLTNTGENSPRGMLGKKTSPEARKKLSIANSGAKNPMYGKCKEAHPRYGKEHTLKSKEKMSLANSGKNHPQWRKGISKAPYGFEFNDRLKEQIRERDNYTCQLCGKHESENTSEQKKHSIHHINYDKKNNKPENLITLCRKPCHSKTNFNRAYWTNYFQSSYRGNISILQTVGLGF